jgi:hypothetical protein
MEELLIVLVQFLFEFALDVLINLPFNWPSKKRGRPGPDAIWIWCILWFGLGCLLAGISLLVMRHSIISLPTLRVANLVAAPIASAYLSQAIASHRARENAFIVPRNHFWQAFWFTLGLTLVRFAYAAHG